MQGPQRAQLRSNIRTVLKNSAEVLDAVRKLVAIGATPREFEPRLVREPRVRLRLHRREVASAFLREIERATGIRIRLRTKGDLVNPPAGTVHAGAVVTLSSIAPIEHKHAAVRPRRKIDAAE